MTMPKAYEPEQGYKYQILTKYQNDEWEHCDYAKDRQERDFLLREYRMSSNDMSYKVIELPMKYWKED